MSSIFVHITGNGTAMQNDSAQIAEMWTDVWGIKGISPSKPQNPALLVWTESPLNYASFWMGFCQSVDRMLIDRHESNQRSNKHYRF
jgi:hypothetical protein